MTGLRNTETDRKQLKMSRKKAIILFFVLFSMLVKAQDEDKVLFSIDDQDVYNAEFIRVFEKNKDIVVEEEHKGFDDYFDLFINTLIVH